MSDRVHFKVLVEPYEDGPLRDALEVYSGGVGNFFCMICVKYTLTHVFGPLKRLYSPKKAFQFVTSCGTQIITPADTLSYIDLSCY